MSRLDEIEKMLISTDKMQGVGIRKEIDFRHCAFEALKEAGQLSERVEELEEENRSLNREIGKWSNHVWAIAEESFVVGSKAKQLLNEMIKGESE